MGIAFNSSLIFRFTRRRRSELSPFRSILSPEPFRIVSLNHALFPAQPWIGLLFPLLHKNNPRSMNSLPWLILLLLPVASPLSLSERVDVLDEKSLELVGKAKTTRRLTKEVPTLAIRSKPMISAASRARLFLFKLRSAPPGGDRRRRTAPPVQGTRFPE